MKAMQKFIHLCLVVAILLASTGFRVREAHCAGEKSISISFASDSNCCCAKDAKTTSKPCGNMSCIIQQGIAYSATFNSPTQQVAKFAKEPISYPDFTESIRPAILERTPHFTLPPPVSGRFIGILHQTFII
jgi:hypothetical protein